MTRLLESLVGHPLLLTLNNQEVTTGHTLHPAVRAALRCADDEPVIVRESTLLAGDDSAVSRNYVALRITDGELTALLTDKHLPIGRSLANGGRHLIRMVHSVGVTTWSTEAPEGPHCVYKVSTLCDHLGAPVVYLHERLSPDYAPLRPAERGGEHPAPATAHGGMTTSGPASAA